MNNHQVLKKIFYVHLKVGVHNGLHQMYYVVNVYFYVDIFMQYYKKEEVIYHKVGQNFMNLVVVIYKVNVKLLHYY